MKKSFPAKLEVMQRRRRASVEQMLERERTQLDRDRILAQASRKTR